LYNLSQAALEAGHAEIFVVERAADVLSAGISLAIQRRSFARAASIYISQARAAPAARNALVKAAEDHMPTFILTLNWTDQGIRAVKDAPKRSQAAKELAKTLGVDVKQVYLTSGEHDLLIIVESPSGDNVSKFALATGSLGNVRTSTARAWSEPEFHKLISELP
jgi:uncharacterized protein with GYD domain